MTSPFAEGKGINMRGRWKERRKMYASILRGWLDDFPVKGK